MQQSKVLYIVDLFCLHVNIRLGNITTVLPRYNANIVIMPFFNIMAGWHYGEGGDLGLWIYASRLTLILIHVECSQTFSFFQAAETGNRTPNSGVKGSGAKHYPKPPAPRTIGG